MAGEETITQMALREAMEPSLASLNEHLKEKVEFTCELFEEGRAGSGAEIGLVSGKYELKMKIDQFLVDDQKEHAYIMFSLVQAFVMDIFGLKTPLPEDDKN